MSAETLVCSDQLRGLILPSFHIYFKSLCADVFPGGFDLLKLSVEEPGERVLQRIDPETLKSNLSSCPQRLTGI